ncbi:GNAT family N-acetyltransferase [Lederbergia graminis]|uniref:GNAT family N-acetyltransferase n=1 Tax=Lederbergia graminis TaxID=735518 RepID=A0ABW0LLX1_9BACI
MDTNISISIMEKTDGNLTRITKFLHVIGDVFYIPLHTTVSIESYAKKIHSNGVIVIAEHEGQIIGALLGYANDQINKNAYISAFGILKDYRSKGIGSQLLSTMKEFCRKNGMHRISLYTHKSNKSAIRFYQRNYFTIEVEPKDRDNEIYLVCDLNINMEKGSEKSENVLITAIGSFSADIVIKTLKSYGHYIVGCDINPKEWVAEAYDVNQFYQAPYARNKEEYITFIEKICDMHKIKFILPLTDPEVDLLATEKNRLQQKGIKVCIADEQTIKLCRDKYMLSQFLINQEIKNVIPTSLLQDTEETTFPLFIKPRSGRSSEGCQPILDQKEYGNIKEELEGSKYIIQPLIEGRIITVDVIRDPKTDNVVCISRRELLRNKSGAGTTIEIIDNEELEHLCSLIARKVGIIGAVNFEFIETSKGEYYFLEINPRFSGGVEFSHIAGYDVVGNHLNCFSNKVISEKGTIKKVIIARKYEEYVTRIIK